MSVRTRGFIALFKFSTLLLIFFLVGLAILKVGYIMLQLLLLNCLFLPSFMLVLLCVLWYCLRCIYVYK